jgi:proliferating cell nuclear antigen PCNA
MDIQINNSIKADLFAAVFQNMKLFSDSVNIILDDGRMFLQTMDSGRISILELNIPSTWFDKYESTNMTIGVNSIILFKILSTRDKCQNIEMKCNRDADKLLIRFYSDNKSIFDKTFEMPLIDIDVEYMTIPVIDYQAEFSLPSTNFSNLINQLKMFGDSMEIECSEDKIVLYSDSQDYGKMSAEISIDELTSFVIDEGEQLKMSFSLSHLHYISQFHKLSKEVELKFKHNYPIQIVYNLGDVDTTLRFFLAPKISDDDE